MDLKQAEQPLKCSHCGHTGSDVIRDSVYIGGQGLVPVIQCRNRVVCWHRQDEALKEKTLGDVIADELDKRLNNYCPNCQNGIDWRNYSPELADRIAAKVEDYLKPKLLPIVEKLNEMTQEKR